RERAGQRARVQVVHLERRAAPWARHRIAATAVWGDEHDRRAAAQHGEGRRHGCLCSAATIDRLHEALIRAAVPLLVLCFASPVPAHGSRPPVYLVVVDGLGADGVDPVVMPRVAAIAAGESAIRTEARAAMPTRTNPNHATLLTGLAPESHGITGNAYWD